MVEHEKEMSQLRVEVQAICLAMLAALFSIRSGRTQQGITNFSPI